MVKVKSAACPNCGANLKLTRLTKTVECEFCNSTVIVQDAVECHKEQLIGNANDLIELGEYNRALSLLEEYITQQPKDYRGWLGLLVCVTRNFTIGSARFSSGVKKYYKNYLQLAPEDIKEENKDKIEKYFNPNLEAELRKKEEAEKQRQKLEAQIAKNIAAWAIIWKVIKDLGFKTSILAFLGLAFVPAGLLIVIGGDITGAILAVLGLFCFIPLYKKLLKKEEEVPETKIHIARKIIIGFLIISGIVFSIEMNISGLFFLLTGLSLLPRAQKRLKFSNKATYITSSIIFFFGMIIYTATAVPPYVGTWVSEDGYTVEIMRTEIRVTKDEENWMGTYKESFSKLRIEWDGESPYAQFQYIDDREDPHLCAYINEKNTNKTKDCNRFDLK